MLFAYKVDRENHKDNGSCLGVWWRCDRWTDVCQLVVTVWHWQATGDVFNQLVITVCRLLARYLPCGLKSKFAPLCHTLLRGLEL